MTTKYRHFVVQKKILKQNYTFEQRYKWQRICILKWKRYQKVLIFIPFYPLPLLIFSANTQPPFFNELRKLLKSLFFNQYSGEFNILWHLFGFSPFPNLWTLSYLFQHLNIPTHMRGSRCTKRNKLPINQSINRYSIYTLSSLVILFSIVTLHSIYALVSYFTLTHSIIGTFVLNMSHFPRDVSY